MLIGYSYYRKMLPVFLILLNNWLLTAFKKNILIQNKRREIFSTFFIRLCAYCPEVVLLI